MLNAGAKYVQDNTLDVTTADGQTINVCPFKHNNTFKNTTPAGSVPITLTAVNNTSTQPYIWPSPEHALHAQKIHDCCENLKKNPSPGLAAQHIEAARIYALDELLKTKANTGEELNPFDDFKNGLLPKLFKAPYSNVFGTNEQEFYTRALGTKSNWSQSDKKLNGAKVGDPKPDFSQLDRMMERVVDTRWDQDPNFKAGAEEAARTGTLLAEVSQHDSSWAAGPDGGGQGKLGILILQKARRELKSTLQPPGQSWPALFPGDTGPAADGTDPFVKTAYEKVKENKKAQEAFAALGQCHSGNFQTTLNPYKNAPISFVPISPTPGPAANPSKKISKTLTDTYQLFHLDRNPKWTGTPVPSADKWGDPNITTQISSGSPAFIVSGEGIKLSPTDIQKLEAGGLTRTCKLTGIKYNLVLNTDGTSLSAVLSQEQAENKDPEELMQAMLEMAKQVLGNSQTLKFNGTNKHMVTAGKLFAEKLKQKGFNIAVTVEPGSEIFDKTANPNEYKVVNDYVDTLMRQLDLNSGAFAAHQDKFGPLGAVTGAGTAPSTHTASGSAPTPDDVATPTSDKQTVLNPFAGNNPPAGPNPYHAPAAPPLSGTDTNAGDAGAHLLEKLPNYRQLIDYPKEGSSHTPLQSTLKKLDDNYTSLGQAWDNHDQLSQLLDERTQLLDVALSQFLHEDDQKTLKMDKTTTMEITQQISAQLAPGATTPQPSAATNPFLTPALNVNKEMTSLENILQQLENNHANLDDNVVQTFEDVNARVKALSGLSCMKEQSPDYDAKKKAQMDNIRSKHRCLQQHYNATNENSQPYMRPFG